MRLQHTADINRCGKYTAQKLFALFLPLLMSAIPTGHAQTQQRIERSAEIHSVFDSPARGLCVRWWRKFCNPSFCTFVLCAGSCADISGKPRIGSYSSEELISTQTPCSLKPLTVNLNKDGCCSDFPQKTRTESGTSASSCTKMESTETNCCSER